MAPIKTIATEYLTTEQLAAVAVSPPRFRSLWDSSAMLLVMTEKQIELVEADPNWLRIT